MTFKTEFIIWLLIFIDIHLKVLCFIKFGVPINVFLLFIIGLQTAYLSDSAYRVFHANEQSYLKRRVKCHIWLISYAKSGMLVIDTFNFLKHGPIFNLFILRLNLGIIIV